MQQLLIGNLHAEWLMPGSQGGGSSQEPEMEPHQQQSQTEGTYVTGGRMLRYSSGKKGSIECLILEMVYL